MTHWKISLELTYYEINAGEDPLITRGRILPISRETIKICLPVIAANRSEAELDITKRLKGLFPAPDGYHGPYHRFELYEIVSF